MISFCFLLFSLQVSQFPCSLSLEFVFFQAKQLLMFLLKVIHNQAVTAAVKGLLGAKERRGSRVFPEQTAYQEDLDLKVREVKV